MKTILQAQLLKGLGPYMMLYLAGVTDLASSLMGISHFGLVEGNPHFIPFLTELVLILYIFAIRRITVFPKRIERLCEVGVVIFSFAPTIWNLALILTTAFA
ncbi:MAG: hypothetical protein ACQCN3_03305 [Candidatus Bathyarchaeia archaeon]